MTRDDKIREREAALFARYGLRPAESFVQLPGTGVRVRVLTIGTGPDLVLLHGVTLASAAWAPLLPLLPGYRARLIDLPGHGLSGPAAYSPDTVREQAVGMLDRLLDALGLDSAMVIGHSLGALFALWHSAAVPGRITAIAAIGSPAGALPGVTLRTPLSLLTVPVLSRLMLASPAPRPAYRRLLGMGLGGAAAAAAPPELLDVLRLASARPGNAATVASLMRALNGFRHPRPGTVMTEPELRRVGARVLFCWGTGDSYLPPDRARSSVAAIPGARLTEVPGGHGHWLEDPARCASLIIRHLAAAETPGSAAPG